VNRRKHLQVLLRLGLYSLPPFSSVLCAQAVKEDKYFPNYIDVANQAGLTAKTVIGGHKSKDFLVSTTGGGIALFDFDNDGWLDIFIVNGWGLNGFPKGEEPTNQLYKNNRDGTFSNLTAKANLVRSGWGQGVCVGDYNNDGFMDLFVTYYGKNVLYRNNGDGTFTDVTRESGLLQPGDHWNSGAAFLDYDRDGHLDLIVSNYVGYDSGLALYESDPSLGVKSPVLNGPAGLEGSKNILYHNNGDGTFTDVSKASGIARSEPTYGFTPCVADYDDDGWPDIYVANDTTPSLLFKNNHNGTFTEVGLLAGVAVDENGGMQSGMGVDAGDYDGDGLLDIVKTNFSDQTTSLYHNRGSGFFTDRTFQAGLSRETSSVKWGTAFVDFDNDGQLDIFIVTGGIYPPDLGGNRPTPKESKGKRILYRNLGNGHFEDISMRGGAGLLTPVRCSRGAAFGDIFRTGQVDVVINNLNDAPLLLRNQSPSPNSWLLVRLVGTHTNRAAIGSRVIVETEGRRQVQEVRSGGSFCSQSDLRLHFGLGRSREATRLIVKWLGGGQEVFEHLPADRLIVIQEGKGIVGQEKF